MLNFSLDQSLKFFFLPILQKKIWKKFGFFDQEDGLIPLENTHFLDFRKLPFLWSWKAFFISP